MTSTTTMRGLLIFWRNISISLLLVLLFDGVVVVVGGGGVVVEMTSFHWHLVLPLADKMVRSKDTKVQNFRHAGGEKAELLTSAL
jgi:hypothetical protein